MSSAHRINVLSLPSWFATEKAPLSGVFFTEQARLLTREVHAVRQLVAEVGPRREVSPRHPLAAIGGLIAHRRAKPRLIYKEDRHQEVRFPALQLSQRIGHGGLAFDVRRLLSYLQSNDFRVDVIHAHVAFPAGWIACEVGAALRVPVIVSEHMGPFPFPDLLTADGSLRDDVVSTVRRASVVTAVSAAHREQIRAYTGRSEIEVAPNFVDERRFHPSSEPPRHQRARLLAVGGLLPSKGFETLIRAVALLAAKGRPVDLHIAGEGSDRPRLERLIRELHVAGQVVLLGQVDRDALPQRIREANLLVSGSHFESFGVTLIEAMASGVPVVASDSGGPRDIVTPDTGLLVSDVMAPEAFAAAIEAALEHSWSRAAIRDSFLARFSGAVCTRALSERYLRVIESFRSTRS